MLLPHYTHIIQPKRKQISLSLDTQGELVIKSPKIPLRQIEKILIQKAEWIIQARKKFHAQKGKIPNFSQESELYYLGESYPLRLIQQEKKCLKLEFTTEGFTLAYHNFDPDNFLKQINHFYTTKSKEILPPRVVQWSQKMSLTPHALRFRKTKSQWGSCSSRNTISLNTMLMKLPMSIIDYVIVHELAHIKHKHHQNAFWEEVARYLPEYKQQIAALKHYTT